MGGILAELQRRKVYRVAAGYAVVGWLLIQIATQVFPFFEIPNWGVRLAILLIMLGFPVAVTMAWVFDLTPEGLIRTDTQNSATPSSRRRSVALLWLTLSALTLAAYFAIVQRWAQRPPSVATAEQGTKAPSSTKQSPAASVRSIAVLPFADLSQNKDQEYFGDGMSEELLSMLGKVGQLRVVARTSSFAFKNRAVDAREIGRRLNVGSVLEGSVRRDGQRIRITAELIEVDNGFDLWSETYERELDDLFAVQDEITRAIIDALKIKLAISIPGNKAVDNEAYDLYLQGMFFSNKSSERDLRQSLEFFERSLQKAPENAKAWVGIAKAWLWLADAYVKPLDAYPASKAAALKAIALDPASADAYVYLAEAKRVLDRDMTGALEDVRRALQLDPNSSFAHLTLGLNRSVQGFREEGLASIREAVRLDPLSPIISNFAAMVYVGEGLYDDAIAEAQRLARLDATFAYLGSFMADAYREKGLYSEAIAAYKKAEQLGGEPQPGLAITYIRMGRFAEGREILAQLEQQAAQKYVSADQIASVYVALGKYDDAFSWLQRAYDEHAAPLHGIAVAVEFRPLRGDPRFAKLLTNLGLDARQVLASYDSPGRQGR